MTGERTPDLVVRVSKGAGYEMSPALRDALDDLARAIVEEGQSAAADSDEVAGFAMSGLDVGQLPSKRLPTAGSPLGFEACIGNDWTTGECRWIYFNSEG
jgi:hypothetical protein